MTKKKKVGIVTWIHSGPPNYGQILQAYAMQQLLLELDCDPISVSWRWKDKKDTLRHYFSNKHLNYLYEIIYNYKYLKVYRIRALRFDFFIHKYIKLTPHCYTFRQLKRALADCDILLAGSDQIWNPYLYQPLYYLVFAEKHQKKISYAPSLAVHSDNGCEPQFKCMGKLIDRFDKLSVREQSSIELLSKYTNKEITFVLDPTLLLSRDKWLKLVNRRLIKNSYILCFIYRDFEPYLKKIESIRSQYGSKKIAFLTLGEKHKPIVGRLNNAIAVNNASPKDFLSLVYYADAVITNSFHGANFSVQFGKDLYAVELINKSDFLRDDNRMMQFLGSIGIPERDITALDDVKKTPINYDEVNKRLSELRANSYKFLKEAVELD